MKDQKKPKRQVNPRRTFSIKGQLVAKLGIEGLEKLEADMHGLASKPKRRRRRRRKPVAA